MIISPILCLISPFQLWSAKPQFLDCSHNFFRRLSCGVGYVKNGFNFPKPDRGSTNIKHDYSAVCRPNETWNIKRILIKHQHDPWPNRTRHTTTMAATVTPLFKRSPSLLQALSLTREPALFVCIRVCVCACARACALTHACVRVCVCVCALVMGRLWPNQFEGTDSKYSLTRTNQTRFHSSLSSVHPDATPTRWLAVHCVKLSRVVKRDWPGQQHLDSEHEARLSWKEISCNVVCWLMTVCTNVWELGRSRVWLTQLRTIPWVTPTTWNATERTNKRFWTILLGELMDATESRIRIIKSITSVCVCVRVCACVCLPDCQRTLSQSALQGTIPSGIKWCGQV